LTRLHADFVTAQTAPGRSRLAPDITLYLASEITPLWQASEEFLQQNHISPPFWAFAWPGSEALARHILDNTALVRGKSVLDFAAGGGLAGIAAAKAGAASVTAAEIDPLARAAIARNAAANGVAIEIPAEDVMVAACRWDVILCGDVFYEAPMTRLILPWLRQCALVADVIAADPGRAYAPRDQVTEIAHYVVPTSLELEHRENRDVTLFRILPARKTRHAEMT
jgi:predicted nicotinamide N-methyase